MIELAYPWLLLLLPLPVLMRLFKAATPGEQGAIRAPFAGRWRDLSGSSTSAFKGRSLNTLLLAMVWL